MKKIEKKKCSHCGQVISFRIKQTLSINCPFCDKENSIEKEIQFELINKIPLSQPSTFNLGITK